MIIEQTFPEDIPQLKQLWKQAFGDNDAFINDFFETGYQSDRSLCIRRDQKIVSVLYWFDCYCHKAKTAYLYAITTDESYRGQGLCTHLLKQSHAILNLMGYTATLLVPGKQELFSFYEKLGYQHYSGAETFTCQAESNPAVVPYEEPPISEMKAPVSTLEEALAMFTSDQPSAMDEATKAQKLQAYVQPDSTPFSSTQTLQDALEMFGFSSPKPAERAPFSAETPLTITPYHYAAAKKIQPLDPSSGSGRISIGKPFFLFANTQYECYVADGKLLWIARQGERIFCPDFPFSQDLAPAVVAALGAKEGTFRTNGSQPFALYFQLSHRRVPPQIHFSLAMD